MTSSNRRRLFPALIASILLASGCQCEAARDADDSGSIDGGVLDGAVLDVSMDAAPRDAATDASDAAAPSRAPCAERVAGHAPFAMRLSGRGEYTSEFEGTSLGFRDEHIDVYFPEGRAAGAPFIVTHPKGWPWGGIHADFGELDGSASGTFTTGGSSSGQEIWISGELIGPDDGALISAARNFSAWDNDVARRGIAMFGLCPTDAIPEPVLYFHTSTSFTPISELHLASSVPWNEPPILRASDSTGTEVPLLVEVVDGFALEIRAASAFPPGMSITWEIEGSDVIGRGLRIEGPSPAPTLPTTATSDLTFETEPAADAIAIEPSHDWMWDAERGALIVGAVSSGSFWANRFALVLALGETPDGFTHVRVDQHLWCRSDMRNAGVAIVDALGASTSLELECSSSDEPTSLQFELPGSGPLWLVMVHEPMPDRPQQLYSSAVSMWTLDEVAFEP